MRAVTKPSETGLPKPAFRKQPSETKLFDSGLPTPAFRLDGRIRTARDGHSSGSPRSSARAASIVYLAHGLALSLALGIGLPVAWQTP